jgi:hypothetical protein
MTDRKHAASTAVSTDIQVALPRRLSDLRAESPAKGDLAMGWGRWVPIGLGIALTAALLAGASSIALQSPERDWAPEARAAAQQSILEGVPVGIDVQFADVEVRPTGKDGERWVCGSFAVRNEDGSLGPYRDFWVTVTKVPDAGAKFAEVRANRFGRDDFLDRNSALFGACFAREEVG